MADDMKYGVHIVDHPSEYNDTKRHILILDLPIVQQILLFSTGNFNKSKFALYCNKLC